MHRKLLWLSFALLPVAVACNDPNELPAAANSNFVDTLTLSALDGTPIQAPSAFSILDFAVRTDLTSAFEFAYNVDAAGQPVFLPQAVLGIGTQNNVRPGFIRTTTPFDGIVEALRNGYITDTAIAIAPGDRFMLRSRAVCALLGVPQYGKLEILSIDAAARTVTFRVLVNNNCGYISLQPGIPTE